MKPLAGVQEALVIAIRRTNASYYSLPEDHRPELDPASWTTLLDELARARAVGDRDCALAAIDRWEQQQRLTLAPALVERTT